MNKLTIQINNLSALERLIGGNAEVEVELRSSVAQEFAKKHLKCLATSEPVSHALESTRQQIIQEVQQRCESEICTFKQSWGGSITELKLRGPILTAITNQVTRIVDEAIMKVVDESLKTLRDEAVIKRMLESRFEYYTRDMINREIKDRLEKVKANL